MHRLLQDHEGSKWHKEFNKTTNNTQDRVIAHTYTKYSPNLVNLLNMRALSSLLLVPTQHKTHFSPSFGIKHQKGLHSCGGDGGRAEVEGWEASRQQWYTNAWELSNIWTRESNVPTRVWNLPTEAFKSPTSVRKPQASSCKASCPVDKRWMLSLRVLIAPSTGLKYSLGCIPK